MKKMEPSNGVVFKINPGNCGGGVNKSISMKYKKNNVKYIVIIRKEKNWNEKKPQIEVKFLLSLI